MKKIVVFTLCILCIVGCNPKNHKENKIKIVERESSELKLNQLTELENDVFLRDYSDGKIYYNFKQNNQDRAFEKAIHTSEVKQLLATSGVVLDIKVYNKTPQILFTEQKKDDIVYLTPSVNTVENEFSIDDTRQYPFFEYFNNSYCFLNQKQVELSCLNGKKYRDLKFKDAFQYIDKYSDNNEFIMFYQDKNIPVQKYFLEIVTDNKHFYHEFIQEKEHLQMSLVGKFGHYVLFKREYTNHLSPTLHLFDIESKKMIDLNLISTNLYGTKLIIYDNNTNLLLDGNKLFVLKHQDNQIFVEEHQLPGITTQMIKTLDNQVLIEIDKKVFELNFGK